MKGNEKEVIWGTFRKRKVSQTTEKQRRVFMSTFKVLEIVEAVMQCSREQDYRICLLIITESVSTNGEPPATLTLTI